MKKLCIAAVFILSSGILYSQDEVDIQVPAYPAGVILGNPSLEVNRVGSYSSLVTALTTNISPTAGSVIPNDLALELMPFYMKSRSGSLEELDSSDPFRDLRLSLASSQVVDSVNGSFQRLGFGFRTYLIPGKIENKKILNLNSDVVFGSTLYSLADIVENSATSNLELKAAIDSEPAITVSADQLEYVRAKLVEDEVDLNNQVLAKKLREIADNWNDKLQDPNATLPSGVYDVSSRYGGILELSGALAFDFPTGDLGYSEVNRGAVWISYHYLPKKNDNVEFTALLRGSNFSYDPQELSTDVFYADLGVNCSFDVSDKFTLTGEYVYRGAPNTDIDPEQKADLTLSYAFKENTAFSISVDQFFMEWQNGVTDPTQLALSLIFGLKN
ncbi:hypothetical protein O3Q51_17010 [Cryomorphaceae bacterium 1068]|nr:hypothetical protein [Cryomorphaceae bacterium 1068]